MELVAPEPHPLAREARIRGVHVDKWLNHAEREERRQQAAAAAAAERLCLEEGRPKAATAPLASIGSDIFVRVFGEPATV